MTESFLNALYGETIKSARTAVEEEDWTLLGLLCPLIAELEARHTTLQLVRDAARTPWNQRTVPVPLINPPRLHDTPRDEDRK